MWCTKRWYVFQGTKLISQRSWTWAWTSDPILQLLIVTTSLMIHTVLCSFPSLSQFHTFLPVFSSIIIIPNKVTALKFCSRSSLGGSKLRHSSALFFLLSFHFLNFCSGPKKQLPKSGFFVILSRFLHCSWKVGICMTRYFCRINIFCDHCLHLMFFIQINCLKDSGFGRFSFILDFPMRDMCMLQKHSLSFRDLKYSKSEPFHVRIKVMLSTVKANPEAWEFN